MSGTAAGRPSTGNVAGPPHCVVPVGHHDHVTATQEHPPRPEPGPGPGLAAVVREVRRLRSADPLSRITVLVPSFAAARDLVRALALHGGAVNVHARTASQAV
ncbi:MAG TPA: hypothetical protein GX694_13955, partial [Actinomycetales bacterium]|nr:hypothetical protein [Actinomycetales bacterium]